MHAYDALTLLFEAVAPLAGDSTVRADAPREASQMLTLLTLVRNSVHQPFEKLPQASAVFLAEAAAAALNPSSFLYAPLNTFLLKRAVLPRRGLTMFSQLHNGQTRDWRRRLAHAHALARAAPQASAPRMKLAAAAASTPCDAAAVTAFLRAASASAALPASCMHMLRHGTLSHVAACAAAAVSNLRRGSPSTPAASSSVEPLRAHFHNAIMGMRTLQSAARVEQLWRGEARQDAVATYTCGVWGVLGALQGLVDLPSVLHTADRVALLSALLALVHTYLCAARAWHHSPTHPCAFELRFWQHLLKLAKLTVTSQKAQGQGSTPMFATMQRCLLCSSLAAISGGGSSGVASGTTVFPSEEAHGFLRHLWDLAGEEAAEMCPLQVHPSLPVPAERYSVRLLAWVVAGACQRHHDITASRHGGASPSFSIAMHQWTSPSTCTGFSTPDVRSKINFVQVRRHADFQPRCWPMCNTPHYTRWPAPWKQKSSTLALGKDMLRSSSCFS